MSLIFLKLKNSFQIIKTDLFHMLRTFFYMKILKVQTSPLNLVKENGK